MKKRNVFIVSAAAVALCLGSAVFALTKTKLNISRASVDGEWSHYSQTAPTATQKGTREYWVECGGGYQFSAPTEYGHITDKGTAVDTSGFAEDDDRWINFQYDEDHLALSEYAYGAVFYLITEGQEPSEQSWRTNYDENGYTCRLFSASEKNLFRIDLPRIDFTVYTKVTMKVTAPNWYNGNMMGPEPDQLTYHTVYGDNKTAGKIIFTLQNDGLHMYFNSMEYADTEAFSRVFTDSDIIHGLKPTYFYTEDLYDRDLVISNITLGTFTGKVDLLNLNADTTRMSAVNGDVKTIGSVDYSIINNEYATNETGLVVQGNANPGAAVITLPTFNFNSIEFGKVTFEFGVKNNGETMKWGTEDSLGTNSPTSQTDNNNGYVNWLFTYEGGEQATILNRYTSTTYTVTLSQEMLAGTAGIVISGGGASIYRVYLVTTMYWSL